MQIRKGKVEENEAIAKHLLLAMEDIAYLFIGDRNYDKALHFMKTLVGQQGNQYSYDNNWVVLEDDEIVATALVYPGDALAALRAPVAHLLKTEYQVAFNPEDETQAGEYYIDCIGVSPSQQGKGIGSQVLQFLIANYVEQEGKVLGLLVDEDNPKAKRLYDRLGFEVVGEKTLLGKRLEHMQVKPQG